MMSFDVGNKKVGGGYPCYVIAEAGVNHNGDLQLAKQLIEVAAEAGVDAVKFQSFVVDELILPEVEKAPYQKVTTDSAENQFQMLRSLEIDKAFHEELLEHCKKRQITFLSTPYDSKSLELLGSFQVPAIKIASTDTTNVLFLEQVAAVQKPVILSTGMSDFFEIEQAYRCLRDNGCSQIALLKCTTNYPTDPAEVNLQSMLTMMRAFPEAVVGFSDHTAGIGASPYAVACGAKIVEKHFTLDKSMPGPDHAASLEPDELKSWVAEIRSVEVMLGSAELGPASSELLTKKSMQKCLVSVRELQPGDKFSRTNITAKRTGGRGIPAAMTYRVLGKCATRKVDAGTIVTWALVDEAS